MKVIHIASGDLWAGAENQVYQLIKELNNIGNGEFKLILFNHGKLEDLCVKIGCDVIVIDERYNKGLKSLFEIYKYLKKEKPDIVHTHGFKQNILGAIASFLTGSRVSIRTIHGRAETPINILEFRKYILYLLDSISALMQKKYVVVADDLYEYSVKRYFNRSVVIENGIDIEEVKHNALNCVTELPEYERIKIGFVGRVNPVKNPELFIKIQSQLINNKINNFVFLLFGDGLLRASLEDNVRDDGLSEHVRFFGHVENIESAISQLDVLLMTSQHEGLPMTLLEAMALKTPVISNSVGGIPKVLGFGECGTLIDCEGVDGYVNQLVLFKENKSEYISKASNAYKRVKEKYSSSYNARQYMKLYMELLSNE